MDLVVETEIGAAALQAFEDGLYAFNVQATGIADGKELAVLLRGADGAVVGGVYGWSWGGTCYVRYLFLPTAFRGQGLGTRLMRMVEAEALARRCTQIVLETHGFQAPGFYRRLGFRVVGTVEHYPRGHSYITMAKTLRNEQNRDPS